MTLAGGCSGARLGLHLHLTSPSSCRFGHEWARAVAADRFDDQTRVLCQDCNLHVALAKDASSLQRTCAASPHSHHLHQFIAQTDVSFVCCQCSESTVFNLSPQAFPQQLLDALFKGRTVDDRLRILEILIAYTKGYLERIGKPINSQNQTFTKFIGGSTPVALAAMKVLGFELNANDSLYYPVDASRIDPASLLPQQKLSLFALEELLVSEWNLNRGLGKTTVAKNSVDCEAGSRLIFGWLGSEVVKPSTSIEQNLLDHYMRLGCTSTASDEKIKWAFLKQLDDDYASRSLYLESLIGIANSRPTSFSLPEFIAMERTKRNLHTLSELTSAYNLFALPPPNSEAGESYRAHLLITMFQSRAEEQPELLDELRAGLRIIADDQGCSEQIDLYLETGFTPMASSSELTIAEPSDPNKPIGLDNFGNICYLNALIQFYLTIKPLRQAILSVHSHNDAQHSSNAGSTSPSRQQQQQQQPLPPLPKNDNPKRFLLLLKSLFQKLSQKGGDVVSVGVDRDLAVTVLSGSSSGSPPKTSQKMVGVEDPMDVDKDQVDEKVLLNAQQDVGEFMDVFVDMAEKGFRSFGDQKNADMIKRLFFGKTTQTLKYLESTGTPTQSGTQDEFMYLTIDVAHDIYASLDSYFRAIAVDYENRKALRSVKLKSLPPILTLQLQRVQYDVSQGCAVKSNKFMKFYDEIDMAAYCIPPENLTPKKYRLHAVLQHEGEAGFGHYKIYIRNHHHHKKSWFLYDDSRVSVISESSIESTIFRDTTGTLANAYCLLYVDVEQADEMVETFVRGL